MMPMLKMNELVKRSGENKSTLLYYLNEGLLPEPQRPKPNVALYDDKCVEIVKFIRYFQHSLYYSISQIKEIITNNAINFDDGVDMIISSLSAMSIGKKDYSIAEILEKANINDKELALLQTLEFIRKDDFYSEKDIEIIHILSRSEEIFELLKHYVQSAKTLAKLEKQIGIDLLKNSSQGDHLQPLIFDTMLKVKPYIFNNHTLLENKKIHSKETL
jgi:DNA-binding transcriptional MerR regulator